jgi:ketosteroid isomerase-like protein
VRNPNRACLRLPLFALLLAAACSAPRENAADAIRAQITKYAAAFDAADVGLASQVWLTSPEISFINPAVHSHGWEEVKGVYEFFGTAFSERKLTVRDLAIHAYGDGAWAEFYWHFDAKQRSDGAEVKTDGRESQVYRKVDGRWALVHVHYSGMPAPLRQ